MTIYSPYARRLHAYTSDPSTDAEGQVYFNTTSNRIRVFSDGAWIDAGGGGGGVTNSAGANVVPKSDGTNLVASRISDSGSAINIGPTERRIQINDGTELISVGDITGANNGSKLVLDDASRLLSFNRSVSLGDFEAVGSGTVLNVTDDSALIELLAETITIGNNSSKTNVQGQINSLLNHVGNSSTAKTINWSDSNVQGVTMTGNATFSFSNPVGGGRYTLLLRQDPTGSRTASWPASVKWPGGIAPVLTATVGRLDKIEFVYDSISSSYFGTFSLNYT